MKKIIVLSISVGLLITSFSCKRNDIKQSPVNSDYISKDDAVSSMKKYFILINNISSFPDKDVRERFYQSKATDSELEVFATKLGFRNIELLKTELNQLSKDMKFARDKYPEIFEKGSKDFSEIARSAFIENENKAFYPTQFKPENPYKQTNSFVSEVKKKTVNNQPFAVGGCCPCSDAYNNTMDLAFWSAVLDTAECVGWGVFGSPISGGVCQLIAIGKYQLIKHYAVQAWDNCMR